MRVSLSQCSIRINCQGKSQASFERTTHIDLVHCAAQASDKVGHGQALTVGKRDALGPLARFGAEMSQRIQKCAESS